MIRSTAQDLLKFMVVGSVGFVVEAVILTGLTVHAAWSPWQARIPSFLSAVLITWALNRRLTFAQRGLKRPAAEAFFYTVIQGGGALLNLAVFGACLFLWPKLGRVPVIPLAIGAVAGLAFNFLLTSKWLYSRPRPASG